MPSDKIPLEAKAYSVVGTEQEVRFIIDVLKLPIGSKLLDLYCGYGRHVIELAKHGYCATGVDATQAFLDIAVQKAHEAGVAVKFELHDMRELNYQSEFDAIINMFAAFGYFSDAENAQVLNRVAAALHPGGLFLIDLLNRDWMLRNNLNRYWRHPSGEYMLSYKAELVHGVAVMKRELINQNTGEHTKSEFLLRAYSQPELVSLLEQNGLHLVDSFGGFDGRPYGENSPRMILLTKKN